LVDQVFLVVVWRNWQTQQLAVVRYGSQPFKGIAWYRSHLQVRILPPLLKALLDYFLTNQKEIIWAKKQMHLMIKAMAALVNGATSKTG
jgi:hypothetical protein